MAKYVAKRIALMLVSGFIIMTMLFVLIRMLPNQVQAVQGGYDQAVKDMREAWGYNKPIMVQYGIFLKNVFTEWNWGFCTTVGTYLQDVTEYLASKLPATIYINVVSIVISIPLGVIFGIVAAIFKNRWQDQVLNVFIMFFISVPAFVYAFLLQYYVGFKLGWFPLVMEGGTDYFSLSMLRSAVMPILAMSFGTIAGDMRLVRAELTETLTSDYMLLARTKGLSYRQATIRHALRNSMVPLLPTFMADVIYVVSGSMIIEQIFSVPGIGKTYLQSITMKDYSVFMCISMFYVAIGLVSELLFDLSYGIIDPRIRMGGGKNNEL
ncbi:MAG: ABC transporter permease [Clostridiales bacterium]|nr:ABC transporter permease [Clostridiales bacterium]MCD8367007.1 ABC transporter permease [Clostridiales bacterium]